MLLSIVDTETTGTNPQTDALAEVACVLYRVGYGAIQSVATVLPVAENLAQGINKISPEMTMGVLPVGSMVIASALMERADYLVAHNAEFDRSFLSNHPSFRHVKTPWLCTYEDFEWGCSSKSLASIALHHGLTVDGSQAHRALYDCQLISRVFDCLGDRLPGVIEQASRPKFLYKALVSYDDREKAKEAGFSWDAQNKAWLKKMTEEKASLFEFDTVLV